VYEPGTAVLGEYGEVVDGALGALIARYSYDGVGRLIRIERTQDSAPVTIDLYYDGVRRIQERLTTGGEGLGQQMMAGAGGGESGDGSTDFLSASFLTPGPEDFGTSALGGEFVLLEGTPPPPNPPDDGEFDPEAEDAAIRLDASSTAVSEPPSLEGGELGGGGSQQMSGGGGPTIVAEREYVWGPDYVDECVVQFDTDNVAFYVLQDANYNVVALLKADGLPAVQYTYEPYGALQLAESFTQHPVNRLGHQGLFFERFDAGPYDPALVPGARGLYYARNRWYDPVTGRWMTRDPNETALPVLTALAMNGTMLDVLLSSIDLRGVHGDGTNLYAYLTADPINSVDPLGLFQFGQLLSAVSTGAQIYGIYSTAMTFKQAITDFSNGVSLRSIMLDLTIELALNYAGGKALDALVDVAAPILRGFSATFGQGWKKAAADFSPGSANVIRKWPLHHPWPVYLQGLRDQTLKKMPKKLHQRFHAALDRWKGGKYDRRKGAESFGNMSVEEIVNDLREFYEKAEGGVFSKYIPDLEKAIEETLAAMAAGG
jgi:hypothetical protein